LEGAADDDGVGGPAVSVAAAGAPPEPREKNSPMMTAQERIVMAHPTKMGAWYMPAVENGSNAKHNDARNESKFRK
jgi:hypothetical protein